MTNAEPFVSIVIATRNREALLAHTLETLAGQSWPSDRGEIIVADNGSTDGTRAVIEAAAQRTGAMPVRYLFVSEPGKSHAVNQAFAVARGDLLLLTDDDVWPAKDWVARLGQAFEETGADFIAGRILPRWESPPPAWLSPAVYGVLAVADNGESRLTISDGNADIMPIGANMAVRASVVARVGGLRTDLGKLGTTFRTGEDHEFFLRVRRAGYRGIYEPTAVVQHWVPSARLVPAYFRRWLYQNGRDVACLETTYETSVRLARVPRYLWRVAASDVMTAAGAALTGNHARRFAALGRLIWFAGYVREQWIPLFPRRAALSPVEG